MSRDKFAPNALGDTEAECVFTCCAAQEGASHTASDSALPCASMAEGHLNAPLIRRGDSKANMLRDLSVLALLSVTPFATRGETSAAMLENTPRAHSLRCPRP